MKALPGRIRLPNGDPAWHRGGPTTWSACLLAVCVLHAPNAGALEPSIPRCTGGSLAIVNGVEDLGWTGLGHGSPFYNDASIGFQILNRCTDNDATCNTNDDCANDQCAPTCDCAADPLCDIAGPTQQSRCLTTLTVCDSNADCPASIPCVRTFGPPLPWSTGGVPTCTVSYFEAPLSGTLDTSTGALSAQIRLRSRILLGETLDKPCPSCGSAAQSPKVGDHFICTGGQTPGAACTVEAVDPDFGGTSHDCAPSPAMNISGNGLAVHLADLTTGTATRTAQLPCKNFGFSSNPLKGTGKCIDNQTACASNADCRRCSEDATTACSDDAQCAGKGTCAEAPDQPISCGYWCQCGFCDDNPGQPCFENGDCSQGQTCQMGSGFGNASNAPQQKPNDCNGDKFVCGTQEIEKCEHSTVGHCSLQPWRMCSATGPCPADNAGECVFEANSCFEPRITRSGTASPLGSYCTNNSASCATNEDCGGSVCLSDVSVPDAVALFCAPSTASSVINSVYGITGPAAVRLHGFVKICREGDECQQSVPVPVCGNGVAESGEWCDDGDAVFAVGDYCDERCKLVPCGQPSNTGHYTSLARDAQFALRAAVGLTSCDLRVCDVDDSSDLTTTDALMILKKAVGLAVTLQCPVG